MSAVQPSSSGYSSRFEPSAFVIKSTQTVVSVSTAQKHPHVLVQTFDKPSKLVHDKKWEPCVVQLMMTFEIPALA